MVSKVSTSKFFNKLQKDQKAERMKFDSITMTNTPLEDIDENKSCTTLGQQCFFQDALNVNKSLHRRKMPRPERIVNAKS